MEVEKKQTSAIALTKFIDTIFPFNSDDVAEKTAKRQKKMKDDVLAEWEEKRTIGIRCHDTLEKLLKAKFSPNTPTEELGKIVSDLPDDQKFVYDQLLDFLNENCQGWDLFTTELLLREEDGDITKGFSGKVDALFKNDLAEYMLVEWKFGSKLWMKSFDGKKGLGPFSEFDNCKYNKANMQIAFYNKMLPMHVNQMYIVHMNNEISKTPTILKPSNKMLEMVDRVWSEMEHASTYLDELLAKELERSSSESEAVSETSTNSVLSANTRVQKHQDVMIDLETLSTENNAHVLTIGAVRFARSHTNEVPKLSEMDSFYRRISFESNEAVGMHKSSDTILWWIKQADKVRKEAFDSKDRHSFKSVLQEFTDWFKKGSSKHIWSHGSVFDVTILTEAYKRHNMEPPYKFWDVRDTRTAYDLAGVRIKDFQTDETHHALHDCYNQIKALRSSLSRLKR